MIYSQNHMINVKNIIDNDWLKLIREFLKVSNWIKINDFLKSNTYKYFLKKYLKINKKILKYCNLKFFLFINDIK